jgi:hypothetical protein
MLARLFAASLDLLDSAGERTEGGENPSLAGEAGKSLRQRQLHQNVDDAMEAEDYDKARYDSRAREQVTGIRETPKY